MLAVVKSEPGPGHVSLREMPDPRPEANQVLVEVELCGICGTDLHVRRDTFRNFPPVILGHEFVGRVLEEGAAVKGRTDPQARYAVLGAVAVVCGTCRYCQSGHFMFCPSRRGMGHGVNGAFARYACVRPDQLYQLSDDLPSEEGALLEPLAAAVAAVAENTGVRPGDRALITGPGPIGLLCLMVLARQGIPTLVVGAPSDAARLDLARELGAAETVSGDPEAVAEQVRAFTGGKGMDVAFEVSGAAAAADTCLSALRPLGRYTQVGHFGRRVEVPLDHVGFKQLRLQGSVGYTRATWDRSLELLAGGLRPSRIVTHRFPLKDWQTGFDLFEKQAALKVLLRTDES